MKTAEEVLDDLQSIHSAVDDVREMLWPDSYPIGEVVDQLAVSVQRLCQIVAAIAAATGTAKTAKQAECEASQSGGTKIPHRPNCVCKACTPEAAA